ncbi:MAG: elongator complex protein 3 [Thermodesulfobacteriota bacterium]
MTRDGKPSQRPCIIPIFVPHIGCPHQCVFCNQTSITGSTPSISSGSITEVINEISEKVALRYSQRFSPVFQGSPNDQLRAQRGNLRRREIAFYGGSFTGIEKKVQIQLLLAVQPLIQGGLIDTVRVSTRPDYIDPQTLQLLRKHGVKTVELGVQSMVEEVLRCSKRGHTADDVLKAVELLHGHGFEVGTQIMVGLPGDDAQGYARTVDRVIRLNPHFVRIYPTLVLKGTPLEKWYRSGRYTPLSLKEAVDLCKMAFLKFQRAGIPVIRLGLQSSPELEMGDSVVAGPYHPAFGHLVESSLFYDMASCLMEKSRQSRIPRARVSPSDLSNIRGQKNQNLYQLKYRFGLRDVQIEVDEEQPRGSLILINGTKLDEISYRTLPLS